MIPPLSITSAKQGRLHENYEKQYAEAVGQYETLAALAMFAWPRFTTAVHNRKPKVEEPPVSVGIRIGGAGA